MVKKFLLTTVSFLLTLNSWAQKDPYKFSYRIENNDGKTATLVFTITPDEHWHMYSQFTPDGGALPTVIEYDKNKCFEKIGKATESPEPKKIFNDIFGVDELLFEGVVDFKQKIKIKGSPCVIKGHFTGQICKEACIMIDKEFSFDLTATGDIKQKDTEQAIVAPVIIDTATQAQVDDTVKQVADTTKRAVADCGKKHESLEESSLTSIFIKGLAGGFLALLTPCVFSMIPLTVSFFIKRSGSRQKGIRNALTYSVSIILIFVAMGFVVSKAFGADALNAAASDVYVNMFFFIIFIVFAASFFGAFEITLPSSWINKADAASDKGGLIGIFFMAFTLVLVSFSCTAPVIGGLLALVATGGNNLGALVGMGGFAIALALPFTLFAMFPSWLNSLPKSGGWLNVVKVSLGFLELALALKFLSNVDLAYHWDFLKRELFIALWIIIFGLWGLYLLGKIRFAHDDKMEHTPTGRLIMSVIVLGFTLYLVPGLWGAPLRMISGFPPPDFYKEWKTNAKECPLDLNCFHDLDEAMAYAKNEGKPLMIDFTGWSCVNCRKMEDNVWSNPKVTKHLQEDYVLVSLYVDDKTELSQPIISPYTGKEIKTVGKKWSDLQVAKYNNQSQPWYVLLDNNGELLNNPVGNTPNVDEYKSFLECGIREYKARNVQAQLLP